ncbi:fibroblast growth factor 1-like [Montipora capricornis]|uniref:fibroblast growth factor 1-like n=1 Tax=Montipora foliosa TaxID=591990 RepID=UPI0035F1ADCA
MNAFNFCTLLSVLLLALDSCHSAILKKNPQTRSLAESVHPTAGPGRLNVLSAFRQRPSVFRINSRIATLVTKNPSFEIAVRLFGKTQVFLQISEDGTVNGTTDCKSKYAELKLQSMDIGHQRIKAVATGRFVAMDKNGNLYSTATPNDETIFRETMQSTSFHTFASAKYYRTTLYDTFISIGRNGRARNGAATNSAQNKVKFIIFTGDSC